MGEDAGKAEIAGVGKQVENAAERSTGGGSLAGHAGVEFQMYGKWTRRGLIEGDDLLLCPDDGGKLMPDNCFGVLGGRGRTSPGFQGSCCGTMPATSRA